MVQKKIILKNLIYGGENKIALEFPYDGELISLIKKMENSKWSSSNKCWMVDHTKEMQDELFKLFKGIAWLDLSSFSKNIKSVSSIGSNVKTEKFILSDELEMKIKKFTYWMRSRRYSESTIKTYTDALLSFLRFYPGKKINELNNQDIIRYNNEFILKNKLSSSYQNQVVNALKLFFRTVENTKMETELIHRPKKSKELPNVLSQQEVKKILEAPLNNKHKAMLSIIYSCGLRCGELIRLKRPILILKENWF